jgi:predicted amidohydrolase
MKVAVIQMTSGEDSAANIAMLEPMLAAAKTAGAGLVATPENSFYMRAEGTVAIPDVPMLEHPGYQWAAAAAKAHGLWVLIGSLRAKEAGQPLAYNRSVLFSPTGACAATYDKIHLFDVTLPSGQRYAESSQAQAGERPVVVDVEALRLGLSICYDLRFPALYQALSAAGATVLAVPSAFTRPTGQAHWHTLLKARAIENACYVLAPAQCGTHPGGRETYGHSLIIDPWGEILAEATEERPQILYATLDMERLTKLRAQLPVLAHRRAIADAHSE